MDAPLSLLMSRNGCTRFGCRFSDTTVDAAHAGFIHSDTRPKDVAHLSLEQRVKASQSRKDHGLMAAIEMFIITYPSHPLCFMTREHGMDTRIMLVYNRMVEQLQNGTRSHK